MSGWVQFDTHLVHDGEVLQNIDPNSLSAGRPNLVKSRLDSQRLLLHQGIARSSPILVTTSGVIYDGNHAARAAAEVDVGIEIRVIDVPAKGFGNVSILPILIR